MVCITVSEGIITFVAISPISSKGLKWSLARFATVLRRMHEFQKDILGILSIFGNWKLQNSDKKSLNGFNVAK